MTKRLERDFLGLKRFFPAAPPQSSLCLHPPGYPCIYLLLHFSESFSNPGGLSPRESSHPTSHGDHNWDAHPCRYNLHPQTVLGLPNILQGIPCFL